MPDLDPDPRTAPDDHEDATGADNEGVSSEAPAEGADDEPAGSDESPAG